MLARRDCVRLLAMTSRHLHNERKKSSIDLSGIFPAIPTPFNEDESIAFDKLASNLKAWEKIPFKGYIVLGSNGEWPLLTSEERVDMVRKVRELISKDKLLIVGSSAPSTRGTVELTNKMADVGADAAMILSPGYYKACMTQKAIQTFYEQVADEIKIPVILYNNPVASGVDLSAGLVAQLAEHPNIVAMKEGGGDIGKIARVARDTKHLNFQVVASSVNHLFPSYLVGAVGGLVAGVANILGNEVCKIHQLVMNKQFEEARELHHKLLIPNTVVTQEFSVPGMKAALDLVGMYGGPCRRPLLPLTAEQKKRVQDVFKDAGY